MNGSYYEYFPTVLVFSSLRTAIVFFLSLNIVQLLKKLYTAASSHGKTEKLSLTTFEMALVCERFHTVAWFYSFTDISIVRCRYISSRSTNTWSSGTMYRLT